MKMFYEKDADVDFNKKVKKICNFLAMEVRAMLMH